MKSLLQTVSPRSVALTVSVFAVSSAVITACVYLAIPEFMRLGLLFGEAYLFCFYAPFVLLFLGSFLLFRREYGSWSWKAFRGRARLERFDRRSALWIFSFLVLISAGYFVVSVAGRYIAANVSLLSPPGFMPGGLNPNKVMQPGYFFDVPISGKWWFAAAYFAGWFFNIFGEEFMFRGMLLPLDEKSFGKKAWLFQGTLWGLWHVYWKWNFIPLTLFVALPLVFVVQKTRSTWTGIIIHGFLNIIPLVYIIIEVMK
jgi:membrane protease YdiL (CAAX protease family)